MRRGHSAGRAPKGRALTPILSGLFVLLLGLAQAPPVAAQAQGAAPAAGDVSVERVKEGLDKTRHARLKLNVQYPVATFRTTVEREYLPSFKEQLRQQFELNDLQRQSQDWASRGSGLNLVQLARNVKSAYRDYRVGQIRDEVTKERLALERQ